jgi:hypothetical protein
MGLQHDGRNLPDGTVEGYYTVSEAMLLLLPATIAINASFLTNSTMGWITEINAVKLHHIAVVQYCRHLHVQRDESRWRQYKLLLLLLLLLQATNGWAPIMGVGYYQGLSQWSKGEYAYANQKQDDLAIIATKLSYAPAVNGNGIATASVLVPAVSAGTGTATATGVVAQTATADMFRLQAGAGTLSFTVAGLNSWGSYGRSNLDAAVRVLDASGTEIVSMQNTNGLGVTGTATLQSAGELACVMWWACMVGLHGGLACKHQCNACKRFKHMLEQRRQHIIPQLC